MCVYKRTCLTTCTLINKIKRGKRKEKENKKENKRKKCKCGRSR